MLASSAAPFPESLRRLASGGDPVRAVVAGAHAPHVLEGIRLATGKGWITPHLIGPQAAINEAATAIGWDTGGVEISDVEGEAEIANATAGMAASCAMVIKGQIHTSALLRALLRKEAGIRNGPLAHIFYLTPPDDGRALAISDGALNVAPNMEMRKQILRLLAKLFHALGVENPHIAILAATEEVAPQMPVTLEAQSLTEWAAAQTDLGATVFGPLAVDAALAPEAARIKSIDSPVAGAADALLVPTIETGNALAKILAWCRPACTAGIVLGGKIPILVPSRSDPPPARLAGIALARIVSRYEKSEN